MNKVYNNGRTNYKERRNKVKQHANTTEEQNKMKALQEEWLKKNKPKVYDCLGRLINDTSK